MNINNNKFLFNEITKLNGVGSKTRKYLEKKKIEKIKDVLWDLPYSIVDRSKITELNELEIGKVLTIKVNVKNSNFTKDDNKSYIDLFLPSTKFQEYQASSKGLNYLCELSLGITKLPSSC